MPHVTLKAQRVANKKQTLIIGLDLYQIDYDELVPYLSHKCASSATLHEADGLAKKDQQVI